MSFDRLSSLESQPTTTRRQDDPQYRDDPEFQRFTESLSTKLFELVSNISKLSNEIGRLGTKRDTQRGRERVHDLLEETRDGFKHVGEGIKRAQTWEDLNVSVYQVCYEPALIANSRHKDIQIKSYLGNSPRLLPNFRLCRGEPWRRKERLKLH